MVLPTLRLRRLQRRELMAKPVGTGTFSNLGHTQAFEAVDVIRRRCANFHLGPGHKR
jgi:hypothetical protein